MCPQASERKYVSWPTLASRGGTVRATWIQTNAPQTPARMQNVWLSYTLTITFACHNQPNKKNTSCGQQWGREADETDGRHADRRTHARLHHFNRLRWLASWRGSSGNATYSRSSALADARGNVNTFIYASQAQSGHGTPDLTILQPLIRCS